MLGKLERLSPVSTYLIAGASTLEHCTPNSLVQPCSFRGFVEATIISWRASCAPCQDKVWVGKHLLQALGQTRVEKVLRNQIRYVQQPMELDNTDAAQIMMPERRLIAHVGRVNWGMLGTASNSGSPTGYLSSYPSIQSLHDTQHVA